MLNNIKNYFSSKSLEKKELSQKSYTSHNEYLQEVTTALSGIISVNLKWREIIAQDEYSYEIYNKKHNIVLFSVRFLSKSFENYNDLDKYTIYLYVNIISHGEINKRFDRTCDLWAQDKKNIKIKNKYLQIPELVKENKVSLIISKMNELTDKYYERPITTISTAFLGAGSFNTAYHYKDDDRYKDPVDMDQVLKECNAGNIDFCRKYIDHVKKYDYATCYCASGGHLECLKFLFESSCRPGCQFSQWLFRSKSIECVKWCWENKIIEVCPYNTNACGYWDLLADACKSGNLEIFNYLLENGCPLNPKIFESCVNNRDIAELILKHHTVSQDSLDNFLTNTTHSWNSGGKTNDQLKETIMFCINNGGKWKPYQLYYHNIMSRGVEFCQYMYDLGCPMDGCNNELCYSALKLGNTELFEWFANKGAEYNTDQLLELFSDNVKIKLYLKGIPKNNGHQITFMTLC